MGGFAWVTLATNDSYSLGALVLAHSLKRAGTPHDLVALITPGVTNVMREKLSAVFSLVQEVNILDSKDEANLRLLARPELGITFTKLHCWRLTQYEKCVFVDADALVVRNCDELFEREELSAAPDVGWPDCFNSGVFVFKPSQETYDSLVSFATAKGSFDGGDQGLLNMFFNDWSQKDISKHLPFIYNMCSTATYSYLPAFKQFGSEVRIIHFIGTTKPWLQYLDTLTGIVQPPSGSTHLQPLLQVWWNIFCDNVHPQLNPDMTGLPGALAKLTLGEARSNEQIAFEEHMRKQSWEQGQIDYLGRDSFENIWKKISETLATTSERETSPPQELLEFKKEEVVKDEIEKVEEPVVGTNETTEQEKSSVVSTPTSTNLQESVPVVSQKIESVEKPAETILVTETPTVVPEDTQKIAIPEEIKILSEPVKEPVSPQTPVPESVPVAASEEPQKPAVPAESVPKETAVSVPISETPATPEVQPSLPPEIPITSVQEKPVPIQVAESVLQPEPKESVSQVTSPLGEEAISSIVTAVQESVLVVSEALIDSPTSGNLAPKLENGCLDHQTEPLSPPITSSPLSISESSVPLVPFSQESTPAAETQTKEEVKEPATQSEETKEKEIPKEVEKSTELKETEKPPELKEEPKLESKEVTEQKEKTETKEKVESKEGTEPKEKIEPKEKTEPTEIKAEPEKAKLERRKSSSMEKPLLPSCEPKLTVQIPQSQPSEISGTVQMPRKSSVSTQKSTDSESCESPMRPTRSKEMKAPPTPTVTEATPPTSPPIDPEKRAEAEPKVTKKIVKKVVKKQSTEESEDAAEGESSGKKVTKKVVKKVVKKKEGSEAEGSAEKIKKVVKKTTTTSQLETDKSVPETPPPGSSEVPVPPKRKVKPSSTTSKKSDTEL